MALRKGVVLTGLLVGAGGLLWWWGVPVGRLPGDFVVRTGPVTFSVPLASAVLISLVVTLVLTLFRR
jgi:hypothetical protein